VRRLAEDVVLASENVFSVAQTSAGSMHFNGQQAMDARV
jgi:hypothetical protein